MGDGMSHVQQKYKKRNSTVVTRNLTPGQPHSSHIAVSNVIVCDLQKLIERV